MTIGEVKDSEQYRMIFSLDSKLVTSSANEEYVWDPGETNYHLSLKTGCFFSQKAGSPVIVNGCHIVNTFRSIFKEKKEKKH